MSKLRSVPFLREQNRAARSKAYYDQFKYVVVDPALAREADG